MADRCVNANRGQTEKNLYPTEKGNNGEKKLRHLDIQVAELELFLDITVAKLSVQ